VAASHAGNVTIDDAGKRKGTRVTVSLPLSPSGSNPAKNHDKPEKLA